MEIEFTIVFPDAERTIKFKGWSMCPEYDTLCFEMKQSDKTIEYEHLGGSSFIPNGVAVIKDITIR